MPESQIAATVDAGRRTTPDERASTRGCWSVGLAPEPGSYRPTLAGSVRRKKRLGCLLSGAMGDRLQAMYFSRHSVPRTSALHQIVGLLALGLALCGPACSSDGGSGDDDGSGGSNTAGTGANGTGQCPTIIPAEGTVCASNGVSCTYGSTTCTCEGSWSCGAAATGGTTGTGGAGAGAAAAAGGTGGGWSELGGWPSSGGWTGLGGWMGTGALAPTGDCPQAAPASESSCDSDQVGLLCSYDQGAFCSCIPMGDATQWLCLDGWQPRGN